MSLYGVCFFFFKQKTAYEMRISDWSSDVCSSDLDTLSHRGVTRRTVVLLLPAPEHGEFQVLEQKPEKEVGRVEVDTRILEFPVSPVRAERLVDGQDPKRVVEGKSVTVSEDRGGHRNIIKKNR